ncbi:MAG: hypothetical protein ACRECW_17915 [Phyllobacterium sp.]
MRNFLFSAAGAAILTVATFATAEAFTAVGVVESVNPYSNTVQIQGGDSYKLPAGTDLSGLTAGQRVQVTWRAQNPITIEGRNRDTTISQFMADSINYAQ